MQIGLLPSKDRYLGQLAQKQNKKTHHRRPFPFFKTGWD
jgi:hypothetical protein